MKRQYKFTLLLFVVLMLATVPLLVTQAGDEPPTISPDGTATYGTGCDGTCGNDDVNMGNPGSTTLPEPGSEDSGSIPGSYNPGDDGNNGSGYGYGNGSNGTGYGGGNSTGNGSGDFNVNGQPWCYPGGDPVTDGSVGGMSTVTMAGGRINHGGFDVCSWSCGDDTISFVHDSQAGWVGYGQSGNDENWSFNGEETFLNTGIQGCGEWDTGGGGSGASEVIAICWDDLKIGGPGNNYGGGGGGFYTFSCAGDYDVSASVSIPCPAMLRAPYPRGIVAAPVQFSTSPGGSSASSGSRNWCTPTIRNYTIGVGWDQLPIPPKWDFNDRAWCSGPPVANGWTVYHAYCAASYGLEENGPSLRGLLELPSYQVSVQTYWQPWVSDSWEQWEEKNFNCEEDDEDCLDRQADCGGIEHVGDDECGDWMPRGSGKIVIDLRWFGFDEPYMKRYGLVDTTRAVPPIPSVPMEQRMCQIPVPVIESQGLLMPGSP